MKTKKISRIILLGAVLSIGFSSCQVVNKYKTPELDTEDLYREQQSTDTTSIATIPWQEYFQDPLLQTLIEEGLEKNHDLLAAAQTIKKAEAGLGMARAAYFPSVALVADANRTIYSRGADGSKHVLGGVKESKYMFGVAASWELDVWGRMNRESRASYAQFLSSHAYKNLVRTSLISNIATSYYALVAMDEQLKITKETIELMEESTNTFKNLQEAGFTHRAAVKQSEGLLYGTKVNIPAIESQIRELENTLCLLIGRKPGSIARMTLVKQSVNKDMQVGVPVQMLSRRPDVMQAELAFRTAFEFKNAAQASFYPTFKLDATLGFGAATLTNFFKPINLLTNIVGNMTQPLFARKQLIANLQVRKAEQEESMIRFEQAVLSASKEVSDIMYGFDASLKKDNDRATQVSALKIAVSDTKELLTAGEVTYTEVLQAEQGLLQAQLGQVSDKLEQLQYNVNLYRALGGGAE